MVSVKFLLTYQLTDFVGQIICKGNNSSFPIAVVANFPISLALTQMFDDL